MMHSLHGLVLYPVIAFVLLSVSPAHGTQIESARRDMSALRFERAEEALVDIAKTAEGGEKQEALYLLAGLKSSVSEAEIIYQEVIRIDPANPWAVRAQVELAKIQYSVGHYNQALSMLEQSSACVDSDEACYFQGLSAVMLKKYSDAQQALARVTRGRYEPWAVLTLAEIEMNLHNSEEACRQYRAIANRSSNPTAMYRYAECLERQGRADEARGAFEDVVRGFRNTPEAVLATQKLQALSRVAAEPETKPQVPPDGGERRESGFTLQFGAFHDRANALRLVAQLKPILPGVRIDSDLLDHKEVHRVRYGYFAKRAEAQRRGDEIRRQTSEPFTIMTLP